MRAHHLWQSIFLVGKEEKDYRCASYKEECEALFSSFGSKAFAVPRMSRQAFRKQLTEAGGLIRQCPAAEQHCPVRQTASDYAERASPALSKTRSADINNINPNNKKEKLEIKKFKFSHGLLSVAGRPRY